MIFGGVIPPLQLWSQSKAPALGDHEQQKSALRLGIETCPKVFFG